MGALPDMTAPKPVCPTSGRLSFVRLFQHSIDEEGKFSGVEYRTRPLANKGFDIAYVSGPKARELVSHLRYRCTSFSSARGRFSDNRLHFLFCTTNVFEFPSSLLRRGNSILTTSRTPESANRLYHRTNAHNPTLNSSRYYRRVGADRYRVGVHRC